jgi:long-subunit fatty acid transport protein
MICLAIVGNPRTSGSVVRLLGAIAAISLATCSALAPTPARASNLLAPAVGAADSATVGTRVADPPTASAALFANPAGLTHFETLTYGGGLGIGYGRARIEASDPAGYDDTNEVWTMIPDFGVSVPYGRWRFALGTYGATGSTFDYGPDPALGVPNFLSETVMLAAPLGVAYQLTPRLSIGAEVQPMFGQLRTHFPQGGLDFRYKIYGPGVQGMVGMSWRPTDALAFGLGVRTPGRTWMDGSMEMPDARRQDVDVALQMPTQVFLGATWRGLEPVTLSASVRFTDSSTLGDSTIKYELTPQANIGFVPDAKDEWKFSAAAEYALREDWLLRLGFSWASHIVGSKGVSPLLFDTDDAKIAIGLSRRFDHWVLDVMAGYAVGAERSIPPSTALVFPGKYSMEGAVLIMGLTYR